MPQCAKCTIFSGEPTNAAIQAIRDHGLAYASSRHELGSSEVHQRLEATVAEFLGTEDAITVGMGFATNSLNLPILIDKGCLVISDEKNHASIILGLRLSGATIAIFKHNNIDHMEKVNLIFHKIHNFKVLFFTKFTFSKSHFSQNSHFSNINFYPRWKKY